MRFIQKHVMQSDVLPISKLFAYSICDTPFIVYVVVTKKPLVPIFSGEVHQSLVLGFTADERNVEIKISWQQQKTTTCNLLKFINTFGMFYIYQPYIRVCSTECYQKLILIHKFCWFSCAEYITII